MSRSNLLWSRRSFLASVGLGAAALPLLEAHDSQGACLSAPPKRVVFVIMPDGIDGGSKAGRVSGSDTSISLPDWMKSPAYSGGPSLETLKNQLVYIDGLNQSEGEDVGTHEARPAVFNANTLSLNDGHMNHRVIAGGPTIDYVIGEQLAAQGVKTARRVLNLQARGEPSYRASWRGKNDPIEPERDLFKLAGQLFAGASGTPVEDPAVARRLVTRKLILEHKLKELNVFKGRLGKPDQILIDSWLQSLADLQRELVPEMPTGADCGKPNLGDPFDVKTNENYPKALKAQMDLTVAAFASDVTRVAMLEWDDSWGDNTFCTWLGAQFEKTASENTESGNNHHHISHENGARKQTVDAWYHSQFAYLIGKLGEVQEGNGSLLDNTLVVCTSDGRNGASHSIHDTPWILGGGKNLGIRGGRYLKGNNAPKQHLLAAVAQAVGADIKDFGGRAPMTGLG